MSDDNLLLRDLIKKIEDLTKSVSEMKASVTGTLAEHSKSIEQLQLEKKQLFEVVNNDFKETSKQVNTNENKLENLINEVAKVESDVNKGLEESRTNTIANEKRISAEQERAKNWRKNEAIAILLLTFLGALAAWVGATPKNDDMKLLLEKIEGLSIDDERKGKK